MGVKMVGIRHMGVGVLCWGMLVPMAVRMGRHRFVGVQMVTIAVRMRVLMLQPFVDMLMVVGFEQVQRNAQQHKRRAEGQPPGARAASHGPGAQCAEKRCKAKHRAGAARAKRPLRQQVQAQAQSVAGGAHRQQRHRIGPCGQRFGK